MRLGIAMVFFGREQDADLLARLMANDTMTSTELVSGGVIGCGRPCGATLSQGPKGYIGNAKVRYGHFSRRAMCE